MRRARAYSSSCSQIILANLHPFRRNSLFCSQKITKTPILGSKIINVDNTKKLLASVCYFKQHVRAYLQPFSRWTSQQQINNHFLEGYPSLTPACAGLLELKRVRTWIAKICIQCRKFYAQVVLVYLQPFRRNSLLKCGSQPEIAKNSLKPRILGVQGHSRSPMLTFLRSSSPVLVMISRMSVSVCNHSYAKQANNCKITSF